MTLTNPKHTPSGRPIKPWSDFPVFPHDETLLGHEDQRQTGWRWARRAGRSGDNGSTVALYVPVAYPLLTMPSYLIHRGFLGSTGGRPCAVAMIVADCDSASTATESPPDVEAPPRPKQRRKKQTADAARPKQQPPYAVILFNDEEHTFQYVIETLMKVFGYPQEKSYSLTLQVHNDGKGIVWSGSREVA